MRPFADRAYFTILAIPRDTPPNNTELKTRLVDKQDPQLGATARNLLLVLCTLVALAVAYYFAIALPRHNRDRLEFDREKFKAQQEEKQREQEEKREAEQEARSKTEVEAAGNEAALDSCTDEAEDEYWSYVKLNGQPVTGKPGVYTAPQYIWDDAAKRKKAALECVLQTISTLT